MFQSQWEILCQLCRIPPNWRRLLGRLRADRTWEAGQNQLLARLEDCI